MIRPEAAATLARWRDVLIGSAALAVGITLLTTSSGLPTLFGLALLAVGALLLVTGLRRARFRTGARGPGLVRMDEGRILYMGPETGGMIALDDLEEVLLDRAPDGTATWYLVPGQGTSLGIPEGADGADGLLDALAPLPGLDGGAMVRAVQSRTPGRATVWRRTPRLALT
ncbi:MAG: hypothetical protein AAF264_02710 [Pseudomonadota bacterium]